MTTSQPNISQPNPIDKPRYTGEEKLKRVISHALMLVVAVSNPVEIVSSAQSALTSAPDSCNPEQIQLVTTQNGGNIFEGGCGQYEPLPDIQGEFKDANTKLYNFAIVDSQGNYYGQFIATLRFNADGTSIVKISQKPFLPLTLSYKDADGNPVSITLDSRKPVEQVEIDATSFFIEV